MLRWLFADDFLRHAVEYRIVNFSGGVGTGKSSLSAAFSYFLEQNGLVDHTVATMPLSWAIPAELCPPSNFCVILDELGVELDARSFADKKQNKRRRSTVAFMRKLNVYAVVASRVSPDVSFRSLTVQRAFSFVPLLPLEIYNYGFEDGKMASVGWFAIWDRAWLWRRGPNSPSAKYGNEYVPAGSAPALDLFEHAIEAAQQGSQEPNEIEAGFVEKFCRWVGVEPGNSAYHLSRSQDAAAAEGVSQSGDPAAAGQQAVHGGVVPETVRSGGISFNL